jgi:hypothetical protein
MLMHSSLAAVEAVAVRHLDQVVVAAAAQLKAVEHSLFQTRHTQSLLVVVEMVVPLEQVLAAPTAPLEVQVLLRRRSE